MQLFIKLTHSNSGRHVYIKPEHITSLRPKLGVTLVITSEGRGQYVDEGIEYIEAKMMEYFNPRVEHKVEFDTMAEEEVRGFLNGEQDFITALSNIAEIQDEQK